MEKLIFSLLGLGLVAGLTFNVAESISNTPRDPRCEFVQTITPVDAAQAK